MGLGTTRSIPLNSSNFSTYIWVSQFPLNYGVLMKSFVGRMPFLTHLGWDMGNLNNTPLGTVTRGMGVFPEVSHARTTRVTMPNMVILRQKSI